MPDLLNELRHPVEERRQREAAMAEAYTAILEKLRAGEAVDPATLAAAGASDGDLATFQVALCREAELLPVANAVKELKTQFESASNAHHDHVVEIKRKLDEPWAEARRLEGIAREAGNRLAEATKAVHDLGKLYTQHWALFGLPKAEAESAHVGMVGHPENLRPPSPEAGPRVTPHGYPPAPAKAE